MGPRGLSREGDHIPPQANVRISGTGDHWHLEIELDVLSR
jgi:hypothetical protein